MTDANTRTIKLSRPLPTHKGDLSEIVLKEPALRTFRLYGEPFKVTNDKSGAPAVEFQNEAMAGFLADMSGHDRIVLDDISARDYLALRTAVVELLVGVAGSDPFDI